MAGCPAAASKHADRDDLAACDQHPSVTAAKDRPGSLVVAVSHRPAAPTPAIPQPQIPPSTQPPSFVNVL
jgi:hypothetical protein